MAVPRHVAIIMDGNGRWAESRGMARTAGHEAGAESVRLVTRACRRLGVEALTLYSFSTENWARPEDEVEALMALLQKYLADELQELLDNGIRLRAIGELDRLPRSVRTALEAVMQATAHHTGMTLCLALSYGSRDEILHAVRELASEAARGLDPATIDAKVFADRLYTRGLPDPDLLIRTSGELRVSNFLLWQIAYAEIFVTDVLWPDFRDEHLAIAFEAFGARQRRFGKTGRQVAPP